MDTRRATEGPAGVLDSTSRSPTERNAVDMLGSDAAVETWWEMRVKAARPGKRAGCRLFSPPTRRRVALFLLDPGTPDISWTNTVWFLSWRLWVFTT